MQEVNQKRERLLFMIYLLGFVCMTVTLALFQPLGDTPPGYINPPDEHARFLVPWYICRHGEIPTGFEEAVRIPAYGFSYVMYNAFPYLVQGAAMRLAHFFTDSMQILLYVGRLVDVVCGVLMAIVIYRLSRRLFRDRRFGWLFCFAVMYWPQVVFVHSYINTDSACLLSTAMIVYALVCGYQEGFTRRNCLWLSGGIVLCALSYYNAYGFILVSILLFGASFIGASGNGKWDWRNMLRKGCFVSALVLLGIGWWFIRCGILYDGDILGLRTVYDMGVRYAIPQVNPLTIETYQNTGRTIGDMFRETDFLETVIHTFIAAYGSLSIRGSAWMYRLFKGLFLAAGAGCVWQLTAPDGEGLLADEKPFRRRVFHVGMLGCILIPWVILIGYAYAKEYQAQGRYVLPILVPLFYYLVRGLQRLANIKWVPGWLQNLGIAGAGALVVCSSVYMVFYRALPLYLDMGMVLIQTASCAGAMYS